MHQPNKLNQPCVLHFEVLEHSALSYVIHLHMLHPLFALHTSQSETLELAELLFSLLSHNYIYHLRANARIIQ